MRAAAFVLLAAIILFTRFSQTHVLWIEEAYPTAAAAEILRGKFLYRDIWFDKPPLYALMYLLWDAQIGFALRWAGALYVALSAALGYRCALDQWGKREALFAAALFTVYLSFGVPSAVFALAPDLLTVAPSIAAVWLALRHRPVLSGVACAIAALTNLKALFLLPVCAFWLWPSLLPLVAGFAAPIAFFAAVLLANGAFVDFKLQVWDWGLLYSRDTFIAYPLTEGVKRTWNWAGFHVAALIGAGCFICRERNWRWIAWCVLALLAVIAGYRFFPRYYFLLLTPVTLMAARGLANLRSHALAAAIMALTLIPVIRFAPRDWQLWRGDHNWNDLAMLNDSEQAASIAKRAASANAAMLVWGYRPDIFALSGLPAATKYLDSQPLNGVMADRHLFVSHVTAPDIARANRESIKNSDPQLIVDGLGPYNAQLAITKFFDLSGYREIGRTAGSVVYQRLPAAPNGLPLLEKR